MIIDNANCEEKVTNEKGGKQSKLENAFHLIDPKAIFELAHVLYVGEKTYGRDNWKFISREEHLNHAISHIYAHLYGDTGSNHLAHAFTRLMMAVACKDA